MSAAILTVSKLTLPKRDGCSEAAATWSANKEPWRPSQRHTVIEQRHHFLRSVLKQTDLTKAGEGAVRASGLDQDDRGWF